MYILTDSLLYASFSILIWRSLTYFNYNIINTMFNKLLFKMLLSIIIFSIIFFKVDIKIKLYIEILLFSFLSTHFNIYSPSLNLSNTKRIFCIILGMLISGFLLTIPKFYMYYLNLMSIIIVFIGNPVKMDLKKMSYNINIFALIFITMHNYQYYLFAFYIPILAYIETKSLFSMGFLTALNWILFLFKDYLFKILNKYINYKLIIFLGFLINAIILQLLFFRNDNFIYICTLLLLQGIASGISECFWQLNCVSKNFELYFKSWKYAGILGMISSCLLLLFINVKYLFLIASCTSIIASIFVMIFKENNYKNRWVNL